MYCTNTLRIVIISIAMVLAFVATFGLLLPFNELFTVFSLFNTYLHHSDSRPEPDSTVCFPPPRP